MSLEYAAEAVRSKGRGDDTMLVHMTPGEVKGLQQLAMAYGGSLSTNPDTGLPEAGFLKSLLPTLIGAGLVIGTGGAVTPLMAGFGVGAVETLRTGDLGRGLMAGLGAYGGAGLGSAAYAAGNQAGTMAASEAGRQTALQSAATQTPSLATTPLQSTLQAGSSSAFSPVATQAAPSALQTAMQAGSSSAASGLATPIGAATYAAPTTVAGNFAQAGSGLSNILGASGTAATQEAARTAGMASLGGGMGAAKTAGAALIEPLTAVPEAPTVAQPEYNYDGPYKPTERKVRYPGPDRDPADSSEFQYFDVVNPSPGFEPIASSTPLPENTYGPDAPRFAGIPVEMATDPERMRDYQQNPDLYSFAKGGVAKPEFTQMPAPAAAAPINTAPQGYVAGRDAEFNYGFQPMANVPAAQPVGRGVSGIEIGPGTGFAATNLTGAQHSQLMIDQFKNHPKFGPQLRAAGYAEGGATTSPPEGYVAGRDAEFVYGFQPLAAQVPEIQQAAAKQNELVQARIGNDSGGNDYYSPGVPFNQVNNPLPQEARMSIADQIRAAQMERALAAAEVAQGASPSEGGNWQGNETPDGGGYDTMSGAGSYSGNIDRNEAYFRRGGELNMDNGGFIADSRTVSEAGNGSSDAGHAVLALIGGEPIKGPGDGTSDSIPATIGGVQEARVANDESYFSRDDVKALGGGDLKKGEKMLYQLMAKAHEARRKSSRGRDSGLDKLIKKMAST